MIHGRKSFANKKPLVNDVRRKQGRKKRRRSEKDKLKILKNILSAE